MASVRVPPAVAVLDGRQGPPGADLPAVAQLPLIGVVCGSVAGGPGRTAHAAGVWHTETAWEDVAAVCQSHPRLPVIVEGPNRKLLYHNRVYYRLLERFANFHLEIHNLVGYLGLDDVVRRFGSQRLIFGTYFPQQDPNVPDGAGHAG